MGCPDCSRIGANSGWHGSNVRRHPASDGADAQRTALKLNAARLYDEQLHNLIEKNMAYSPLNISQAPFGVMEGLITRISDKFYRAINLIEDEDRTRFESLEDTFRDLMGYSAIAVLCLRGEWPGVRKGGERE